MELFAGKYYLWQGDAKYHAIHAKKRGRIALVSGECISKVMEAKYSASDIKQMCKF